MSRNTWERMFGGHSTAIVIVVALALFVPGTLWAVDPFQNVAIQDPVSGNKAAVTAGRSLKVNGVVSATENRQLFSVSRRASLQAGESGGSNSVFYKKITSDYTVPAGRVLHITGVSAATVVPDFPISGGMIRVVLKGTPHYDVAVQLPISGPRAVTQPVDFVVGEGELFRAHFQYDKLPQAITAQAVITGELLPAPALPDPVPVQSPTDYSPAGGAETTL